MIKTIQKSITLAVFLVSLCILSAAQTEFKTFTVISGSIVEINNPNGRITVSESDTESNTEMKLAVKPESAAALVTNENVKGRLRINVPKSEERIDLEVSVPFATLLKLETDSGQITIFGSFQSVEAESNTGTIYTDTPASNLKYKFLWTASFPRFISAPEVSKIKEKAAGKHVIEGFLEQTAEAVKPNPESDQEDKPRKEFPREIYLRTARGIILFNVPPSQVPNNLLPKEMTNAVRAIIRSGDSILVEAVRRSDPVLFGDYASTLPPYKAQPLLTNTAQPEGIRSPVKRITVQVTDSNNRALPGLSDKDFSVSERGVEREILDIQKSETPFNLLLLLDVSGSVENYVDFIRKAARAFVNTVDAKDKVSIVIFNDDVKVLSVFTSDKDVLSDSLDTFDAGGGTALYDAIGYGLSETIRPLRGDRTAIVILSDGDDNRSFLPFEALLGSIQESGALVYPMYVPSNLIASTGNYSSDESIDPLRDRYLSNNLSSQAEDEGARLASVSGGVYYPISQIRQLQSAYTDIVAQLRTSYTITFRSELDDTGGMRASPRLRVRVNKDGAFVRMGPVTAVDVN